MPQDDDWRLTNQERYLHGVTLRRQAYVAPSVTWDHDHCAFCWGKFMDRDAPGVLREGYATADQQHWICVGCVSDFAAQFAWTLVE